MGRGAQEQASQALREVSLNLPALTDVNDAGRIRSSMIRCRAQTRRKADLGPGSNQRCGQRSLRKWLCPGELLKLCTGNSAKQTWRVALAWYHSPSPTLPSKCHQRAAQRQLATDSLQSLVQHSTHDPILTMAPRLATSLHRHAPHRQPETAHRDLYLHLSRTRVSLWQEVVREQAAWVGRRRVSCRVLPR